MKSYTVEGTFFVGRDDCGLTEYPVRYTFGVVPGRAATHFQPSEGPTVGDIGVEIHITSVWHKADDCMSDVILLSGGGLDELEKWLLAEAGEQERDAAEGAADHRRQMIREDAA